MNRSKRILISSALIMIGVALTVAISATSVLYHTSLEGRRAELVEIVRAQARIIEAVATFDVAHSNDDHPGGSTGATLGQIVDAHKNIQGFGDTGEFVMARRHEDRIAFLFPFRHGDGGDPLPVEWSSNIAEPMRRALRGQSGTMVGLDYRGETVLAAYEPIAILNMGIVAKIDMTEVRRPFITAVVLCAGIALLVVLAGVALLMGITRPLVHSMRNRMAETKSILNTVPDSIIAITDRGKILLVNEATERIFGYSANEMVGQSVNMLIPSPDSEGHDGYIRAYLATGNAKIIGRQREVTGLRKDGSRVSVDLAVSETRLGNQRAFTGVVRDITDRVKAETELRQITASLDATLDCVFMFDPKTLRFCYVNEGAVSQVGYTKLELEQMTPLDIKPKFDASSFRQVIEPMLRGEEKFLKFETVHRPKKGPDIPVEIGLQFIQSIGEHGRFLAVVRDITEQKRIEETLRNAMTIAEDANRVKSEFLANMSHELRTPLNGVITMNELLLRTDLDDQQQRYAWLAKSSGDTLLALINDILDFSKIEAGKVELETIDFDMQHVAETVAASLATNAESKNLELACNFHPDVPRLVRGDPIRLQQILLNLTNNAVKFTEQGEVVIRIVLDNQTENHVTVRFTVSDTGIGIPPDHIKRLFKSFSQADGSTTRKYGGTGLGLVICKELVELMGGKIGAISESERGSTFWFTIRFEKQQAATEKQTANLDDLRNMRILVIDDSATDRGMFFEQFAEVGVECETASSGDDVLRLLQEAAESNKPFSLVLVDMEMPNKGGEQLAQVIKDNPAFCGTVLVLLTSTGQYDGAERMRSLGFAGWITKPIGQSQLMSALAQAVACATVAPSNACRSLDLQSTTNFSRQRPTIATGAKILLAEDHEISQEAAVAILTQAGYSCDAVCNGKQVMDALAEKEYALVLMDCQMPGMDGFEATRAIRRREQDISSSPGETNRIPIIALTANAIKGDRKRCLEAGMDDYITKPLDVDLLIETIEAHLSKDKDHRNACANSKRFQPENAGPSDAQPAPVVAPDSPFDQDALTRRWGGDETIVQRLINKFQSQVNVDLGRIEEAVASRDAKGTAESAHALKGAAAYLEAKRTRELAGQLEEMGLTEDLTDADARLAELRDEIQQCLDFKSAARTPAVTRRVR